MIESRIILITLESSTPQQADGVTPMNHLESRAKGRGIEPTSGIILTFAS